ncbi:alpha/beta fold hydrolase [Streptomyces sp. ODS28]|uniref:alpha/beta hydrolase n=1 Tax=Streptomyces sp. ODS28 TaxID=3136688 RepID=UPI0031E76D12
MRKTVHSIDGELLSAYAVNPGTAGAGRHGVVIMHGAGTGDKQRNLPLAEDFAARGHTAVALDFSGHGESSGTLPELSLRRRRDQASGVIEQVLPPGLPLILVGFSMSGQTVADLMDPLGDRVAAVVLCAPGVYGQRTADVPFGAGFTELIREPESWRDSAAFDVFARFTGRAVLVLPEADEVIPAGVTAGLESALGTSSDLSVVRLTGAPHQLGTWLSAQPQHRQMVVGSALSASVGESDRAGR